MRLIDADAAIDALKELTANGTNKGMVFGEDAVHRIEMLPSVQPDPCEDTVSREAVLSMIDTYMNKSVELHYLPTSDGIKKLISILPPAQPDIIRCKDCDYCDSDVVDVPYGLTKKVWWCDRLYAGANENLIVEPDDFCFKAERRAVTG